MSVSLAVILPAAGRSVRFGADKLRATLAGRSVFARTLDAFASRADVAQIIVAGELKDDDGITDAVRDRLTVCDGGPTRAQTVLAALKQVAASVEWVAIHDAARPLVSQALIDRVLLAAFEHGAAAPAMPMTATVKQTLATSLPARVEFTIPRATLWAMQTPQVMRRVDLLTAYDRCKIALDQVTDDVQLLELVGMPVMLVPGDQRNLKITTPMDLAIAELLLSPSPSGRGPG